MKVIKIVWKKRIESKIWEKNWKGKKEREEKKK